MAKWEFDIQFLVPSSDIGERLPIDELPYLEHEQRIETVAIEDKNSWRAYWTAKRIISERYEGACQVLVVDERRIDQPSRPPSIAKPVSGYVYVLEGGNYHKIGLTTDLDARIRAIASGLPFEVRLICAIQSNDIMALEAELHRRFKSQGKHVRAEWFALEPADVEYIKSLAGGV